MLLDSGDPIDYVGPQAPPPDGTYWFGTTTFGQDVYAQFVHGLRVDLPRGRRSAASIAAVIGMVVGFLAGYRGGLIDEILNMLTNVVLVIPALAVLHDHQRLPGGAQRRRAGRCSSALTSLALGGARDPRADVLAADPGVRGPGPAQRQRHAGGSCSARSRPT